MNVRELIALLEKQDQDAPVASDGCDCFGPAQGVEVHDGWVVVTRIPGTSGLYDPAR